MAFSLLDLTPTDSEPIQREGGPGRNISPETEAAASWLQDSLDKGTDDGQGLVRAVTVPAGSAEDVLKALTRAASHMGVGVDRQAVNVKGGKVEIRFRARPRRERKASDDAE